MKSMSMRGSMLPVGSLIGTPWTAIRRRRGRGQILNAIGIPATYVNFNQPSLSSSYAVPLLFVLPSSQVMTLDVIPLLLFTGR